jgi:hypothetical protein
LTDDFLFAVLRGLFAARGAGEREEIDLNELEDTRPEIGSNQDHKMAWLIRSKFG